MTVILRRINYFIVLLFAFTFSCHDLAAQILVWQPGQTNLTSTPETEQPEVQLQLVLSVASEPTPSLKYRFWESPAMRKRGSASEIMARARHANLMLPNSATLNQQYAKRAEYWQSECPLEELAKSDLKEYLQAYSTVLKLVHAAMQCDTITPERAIEFGGEQLWTLEDVLTDVQDCRHFARLLVLESRLAIAEGRFDAAIESLSIGFRLAEYCNQQHPMVVSKLVHLAICGLMLDSLEKLSQHPQCPNLYWALASVPDSYWSNRLALDGEQVYQDRRLSPFLSPIGDDLSTEQLSERLVQSLTIIPQVFEATEDAMEQTQVRLLAGAVLLLLTDKGREELIDYGLSEQEVRQMSPSRVVILSTQIGFSDVRDKIFKWTLLDTPDRIEQELELSKGPVSLLSPSRVILGMMLPAIQALQSANLRTQTLHHRAMLVEALRAHAAAHENELPASLETLSPLPAPMNPQTKNPFEYSRINTQEAIIRNQPMYPSDRQTETRVRIRT
ncbi:MAG: hypothetical protein KDB03_02540 [Planctomycetales bacterium]|nr:hypothetical protein [Planctomycetales bacterium]